MAVEREVFADSSGGILKWVSVVQVWVEGQGTRQQGFWLAWHGSHVLCAIPSQPHTSPDMGWVLGRVPSTVVPTYWSAQEEESS